MIVEDCFAGLDHEIDMWLILLSFGSEGILPNVESEYMGECTYQAMTGINAEKTRRHLCIKVRTE